jgi:hypothetical protein
MENDNINEMKDQPHCSNRHTCEGCPSIFQSRPSHGYMFYMPIYLQGLDKVTPICAKLQIVPTHKI